MNLLRSKQRADRQGCRQVSLPQTHLPGLSIKAALLPTIILTHIAMTAGYFGLFLRPSIAAKSPRLLFDNAALWPNFCEMRAACVDEVLDQATGPRFVVAD